MSIKSSPFGRTELSGNDARQFVEQIKKTSFNQRAAESLNRGRTMLKKRNLDGSIVVSAPVEKY